MKEYTKPEVTMVKLTAEEAVLKACKTAPGAGGFLLPCLFDLVGAPLYDFGSQRDIRRLLIERRCYSERND